MGLFENMKVEPVRNLRLRDPVLAKPDACVRDVIQDMRKSKLGCAILIDDDRKPVGMFTESMLTQMVATDSASLDEPIGTHAASRWAQVRLSDPIISVLEALEIGNVRFLSVVDTDGRIAGLTGQKGLMEYIADHYPGQIMVQRVGQKPYMHKREGA